MPAYDYQCSDDACGNKETIRVNSYKDPNPPCSKCGSKTERLITIDNILFKGLPFGDKHFDGGKK